MKVESGGLLFHDVLYFVNQMAHWDIEFMGNLLIQTYLNALWLKKELF